MQIRRTFVDTLHVKDEVVRLTGPVYKYIAIVLRQTVGARIDLIDSKGYLYRCVIEDIRNNEILSRVLEVVEKRDDMGPRVTLCVSPIKGPRMDWLVEKATELGVATIVPTIFKRTVVRVDDKEKGKKERWKRIALQAARQSGRFSTPEIVEPVLFKDIAGTIENIGGRLVLYEREQNSTLQDYFSSNEPRDIAVVIGPEGGIDDEEIGWLKENGFVCCTLGDNILRSETAPLVVLSIISYEYNRTKAVPDGKDDAVPDLCAH